MSCIMNNNIVCVCVCVCVLEKWDWSSPLLFIDIDILKQENYANNTPVYLAELVI